jgi:UDP-N-acetylmuramyl pentapeptide phosphotransferase/UDP-N-acetylglucosamine-1-phosphate transferase
MTFEESVPAIVPWAAWVSAAGVLSMALTYGVIRVTQTIGVLDIPNDRSSHVHPTPRGGGVSIVLVGFVAAAALLALGLEPCPGAGWAALGALLIAGISSIDDIVTISAKLRLAAHLAAAGCAVASLGPVQRLDLGPFGLVDLGLAGWPLTVVWIVGMTNVFNFMDGIDGIAGITGVAALAVVSTALAFGGEPYASLLAAALGGATAGFLVWNWQPAKIFMGDVGSAFLGYTIAVLPLTVEGEARAWVMLVTACVMWPFLFDATFTLLRRLAKGENILEAHRSHLYQRLVIAGWPHRSVALLYGVLSAAAGGAALVVHCTPVVNREWGLAVVVGSIATAAVGLLALVRWVEAKPTCAVS